MINASFYHISFTLENYYTGIIYGAILLVAGLFFGASKHRDMMASQMRMELISIFFLLQSTKCVMRLRGFNFPIATHKPLLKKY